MRATSHLGENCRRSRSGLGRAQPSAPQPDPAPGFPTPHACDPVALTVTAKPTSRSVMLDHPASVQKMLGGRRDRQSNPPTPLLGSHPIHPACSCPCDRQKAGTREERRDKGEGGKGTIREGSRRERRLGRSQQLLLGPRPSGPHPPLAPWDKEPRLAWTVSLHIYAKCSHLKIIPKDDGRNCWRRKHIIQDGNRRRECVHTGLSLPS